MQSTTTTVTADDGLALFTHRWLPDGTPKGVVQVVHGIADHSARYAGLAEALTAAGYAVYAHDQRGHGRTAGDTNRAYLADEGGWQKLVDDARAVSRAAQEEHPGLPFFLVGHSLGSTVTRDYVIQGSDGLAGLVLSGPVHDPGPKRVAGLLFARAVATVRGRQHPSALLDTIAYGQYNARWKPARTKYDWLSRDEAVVDAYAADPWCGEIATAGLWTDFLPPIRKVNDPAEVAAVRADLPVLILAGDQDPVGEGTKGVRAAREQYGSAGLQDVTVTLYPGARHEVFNETNRAEVFSDLVAWLDAHLPG
jgi:alpha-beta hydrolase superfamily lysophospholipase